MAERLRELDALALDCQAAGATPAHGDLLELGWARLSGAEGAVTVRSAWVLPRTERRVPRAVRELTGWTEASLETALPEAELWTELRAVTTEVAAARGAPAAPVLIHYARFELPFLHDLNERLGGGEAFPFDVVCVHAIAARLFPDLPRRNIRALAGYLGHSPELVRRSAGHVEATSAIWRGLVPLLEDAGVTTWDELKAWLAVKTKSVRPERRRYPLAAEVRRALPDRPGVYRFLRPNGDILYVGKATSLKARIAGHFKGKSASGARSGSVGTERALELLTQVHAIRHTETASVLEAALLETDEIKRLDPPYNVQLRSGDRRAWFASRDFRNAAPAPDDEHRIGPLPSERSLSPLAALIELVNGAAPSPELRARALAVPTAFGPDEVLFAAEWTAFAAERLSHHRGSASLRLRRAGLALWKERGHAEAEASDELPPGTWDAARVRRRLERALVQGTLLVRRARLMNLIADATVVFREPEMSKPRTLVISGGDVSAPDEVPTESRPAAAERRRTFDVHSYDRLRVLVTELRRVIDEGGEVSLRLGRHRIDGARVLRVV